MAVVGPESVVSSFIFHCSYSIRSCIFFIFFKVKHFFEFRAVKFFENLCVGDALFIVVGSLCSCSCSFRQGIPAVSTAIAATSAVTEAAPTCNTNTCLLPIMNIKRIAVTWKDLTVVFAGRTPLSFSDFIFSPTVLIGLAAPDRCYASSRPFAVCASTELWQCIRVNE